MEETDDKTQKCFERAIYLAGRDRHGNPGDFRLFEVSSKEHLACI
jgi:hypothetical protein